MIIEQTENMLSILDSWVQDFFFSETLIWGCLYLGLCHKVHIKLINNWSMWNNYHNWHQPWPSLTICFLFLFFIGNPLFWNWTLIKNPKDPKEKVIPFKFINKLPRLQFPASDFEWMTIPKPVFCGLCNSCGKQTLHFPYTSPRKYGDGWGFCIVRFDAWDRFDWKWQNRSIERDWRDQKSELAVFLLLVHLLFIAVVQS